MKSGKANGDARSDSESERTGIARPNDPLSRYHSPAPADQPPGICYRREFMSCGD